MSSKPGEQQDQVPDSDETSNVKMTRGERRALEAKRQFHARRHRALAIFVGISLLINAVLAWWLHGTLVVEKQRLRIEQRSEEIAQIAADRVAQHIKELKGELQEWTSNPQLLEAMVGRDAELAQTIAEQIAPSQQGLLALRAIPKGMEQTIADHPAPVRFAELDLIRRSTRRQDVLAEASPLGDQWQLQLAAPVPPTGEETAAGSLLATYGTDAIQSLLNQTDANLGEIKLEQTFDYGRAVALETLSAGKAAPTVTAKVSGSYLNIAFTPSDIMVDRSSELPGFWILIISVSTTFGLAISLILARVLVRPKQAPSGEGLVLPKQYKEARSGDEPNQEPSATPEPSTLYQTQDILDITVVEEDADILGLDTMEPRKKAPSASQEPKAGTKALPEHVFRAYDIRGEVGDTGITPELAKQIGLALGSEVQDQGESAIIVARDGRTHSPELCQQLIDGILSTGCDVINIGEVPTPLMHFATHEYQETSSGVMVTASHNGATDNGFKIVIAGESLADNGIKDIRSRITSMRFLEGDGKEIKEDISADYIDRIFSDVALAGQLSVVIDAGNAVPGAVAPALFEELGCDVIPLYCELDGTFPNHAPDPSKASNLQALIDKVAETQADLGVAFDGDGDRLAVVTSSGRIIWPEQLLMLFAKDVLSRNPGADVLFDVKCSKQLNQLISSYGGRPIMWKTGHSHMKRKMQETGALIGGEYSGHIFFRERWYGFDDGLYAAARLMEIITLRDQTLDEVFDSFPQLPNTPEYRVAVADSEKFKLVEQLTAEGDFQSGKATTIDGLRVDFAKGWGLVRASNTGPEITLRFEAETEEVLDKLKQLFKRELRKLNKNLTLDF